MKCKEKYDTKVYTLQKCKCFEALNLHFKSNLYKLDTNLKYSDCQLFHLSAWVQQDLYESSKGH